MKKLIQICLVLLGCLHMIGGPRALVQLYAWGDMLVTYSQEEGFAQAARDTFSGERPCHLCEKLAGVSAQERFSEEPLLPFSETRLVSLLQHMIAPVLPGLRDPRSDSLPSPDFPATAVVPGLGAASPPTPPPRVA